MVGLWGEGVKTAPNLEPHRWWGCGVEGVKLAPNLELC